MIYNQGYETNYWLTDHRIVSIYFEKYDTTPKVVAVLIEILYKRSSLRNFLFTSVVKQRSFMSGELWFIK